MTALQNWADTVSFNAANVLFPSALQEIRAAMQGAQGTVRPVGRLYSFSGCIVATDTVIIQGTHDARPAGKPAMDRVDVCTQGDGSALASMLSAQAWAFPRTTGYAWALGGARVNDVCMAAKARGLAPFTLGGSSGQTLIGAVSTSTHGADFMEGPLPEYVVALHLINGSGDHWIERGTPNAPLISDAGAAALLGLTPAQVTFHRSADAINAALVSLGAAGIVAGALVRLRPNTTMNERMRELPWDQVRAALASGQAFQSGLGDAGGPPCPGTYRYLEVMLNAYASPPTAFVVLRTEGQGAATKTFQRGNPNMLQFAQDLFADNPDYPGALRALVAPTRVGLDQCFSGGQWLFDEFINVLNVGIPDPQPVYSWEPAWPVAAVTNGTPDYLAFLDACVAAIQQGVNDEEPYLGTISLRFTQGTSAFLGMQSVGDSDPTGARFAHIELAAVKKLQSADVPDETVQFLKTVLAHPSAATSVLHWGQADLAGVKTFDATRFAKWRSWCQVVYALTGNQSASYLNAFCRSAQAIPAP
jgi:hypothetical protein